MAAKDHDGELIKRNMHENEGRPAKPADLGEFDSVADAIVDQYEDPQVRDIDQILAPGVSAEAFAGVIGDTGEPDDEKVRTAVEESLTQNAIKDAATASFEADDQQGVELKVDRPATDTKENKRRKTT